MKRDIITIDEDKCNGCEQCIPGCPEGALQVIDGKARLVSDLFCDGLGACLGHCPTGAMEIEQREAEAYDEFKVMANVVKGGENVIKAHLKHLNNHGEKKYLAQAIEYLNQNNIKVPEFEEKLPCGCPGTLQQDLRNNKKENKSAKVQEMNSELNNWPIQLKLMNPNAPYLHKADLVIAADCTAFSYPNFHSKFLKDKVLMMLCPKLDTDINAYVEKLSDIFEKQEIQSITIVHMEVPCCGGVEIIVKRALEQAKKYIMVKDYTISISGEII